MGTDLFEERFHPMQSQEFSFRADIFTPLELLRSATSVNAEIMQKTGVVGTLEPGAFADILAIDGDPMRDIHVMAKPEANFAMIMRGGEFVRNRL
jgi:imidazolonepropionase-like amidohydrolase